MKKFFKKSFWLLIFLTLGGFISHDVYKTEMPINIVTPIINKQEDIQKEIVSLDRQVGGVTILSAPLNSHSHTLLASASAVVLLKNIKDKIFS